MIRRPGVPCGTVGISPDGAEAGIACGSDRGDLLHLAARRQSTRYVRRDRLVEAVVVEGAEKCDDVLPAAAHVDLAQQRIE